MKRLRQLPKSSYPRSRRKRMRTRKKIVRPSLILRNKTAAGRFLPVSEGV